MTLVEELQGLPSFDYTDPQMRGVRFHKVMEELRKRHWLAQGAYGYIVLDRDAGEFFLRTRAATFPGMTIAQMFDVKTGPLYEEMSRNILHINGPDHTRLRSLVNPALSPKAIERYRPAMGHLLQGLFQQAISQAGPAASSPSARAAGKRSDGVVRCEFVQSFAKPYPSQVIADFMGAPLEDAPKLHHWSNWIQRQFDAASMMDERPKIELAVEEFYAYANALLAKRRNQPREDLISKLLQAEAQGDRLDEQECVNLVLNVLIGGVDTTQSQLAHAIRLFAEHPDQWRLLVEDPSLAPRAIEEVLRFEPVTPFTARIVEEEITFRDVTFPPGTIVMVCAFTGNRDFNGQAGVSPDAENSPGNASAGVHEAGAPQVFNLTADRGRARVLTFGAGVHYCLGANLARAELEEALSFLASHIPKLDLDGEPAYESILGIYGLSALPIRFQVGS